MFAVPVIVASLIAMFGSAWIAAPVDGLGAQVRAILKLQRARWPAESIKSVETALVEKDVPALHKALDEMVFLRVGINPEGRVRLSRGVAAAELVVDRPAVFLIKIENLSGGQQRLTPRGSFAADDANPFTLGLKKAEGLGADLVGLPIEYRLLEVSASKSGRSELTIAFQAGQGSEDLGFRSDVPVLFKVKR